MSVPIIAEQIHNIALPSGKLTPIMNMAIYEIVVAVPC
jgi:hypothetical protein